MVYMFYRINLQYLPSVRLADSVVIEPPYVHRRRKADEYIVYLIKKGVMYLEENGETVTLQPGDMYVLDPRYIHVGVKAPGVSISTCISGIRIWSPLKKRQKRTAEAFAGKQAGFCPE